MRNTKKSIVGIGVTLIAVCVIVLGFALIGLTPYQATEPYDIPQSSSVIDESFVVPQTSIIAWADLVSGDDLSIQVEVTAGGNKQIDFSVYDNSTYLISVSGITSYIRNWTVPHSGKYFFVYDNSFVGTVSKNVTTEVTKHWVEIGYRDVTKYRPLLPYEFSYLALLLLPAGIASIVYGFIRK